MSGPDASEVMAVVARRGGVLRAIDADGVGKRDMDDRLDVSRSTINRSVRELEATGLIERTGGGYRRTLAGQIALEEYDAFESRIDGVVSGLDALEPLAADTELDAAMLDGAEVVLAERHSPHLPVTELCDLLDRGREVTGFAPAVLPQLVATIRDGVVDRGMRVDLAVTEPVVERLVSAYSDEVQAAADTGNLTLRSVADDLAYGLLVVETDDGPTAALVVFGESGARALVTNPAADAVVWARDRVAVTWDEADPLPIGE